MCPYNPPTDQGRLGARFKNSRAKKSSGSIRALNLPRLVDVEEDDRQGPVSITLERRKLCVASIEDMWEIVDEWWRPKPIARRYYRIMLEDGPAITLFRDLTSGLWYEQQA